MQRASPAPVSTPTPTPSLSLSLSLGGRIYRPPNSLPSRAEQKFPLETGPQTVAPPWPNVFIVNGLQSARKSSPFGGTAAGSGGLPPRAPEAPTGNWPTGMEKAKEQSQEEERPSTLVHHWAALSSGRVLLADLRVRLCGTRPARPTPVRDGRPLVACARKRDPRAPHTLWRFFAAKYIPPRWWNTFSGIHFSPREILHRHSS